MPQEYSFRIALSAGWRRAREPVGVLLVVIGAIGTLLPIVPGVPVLMLGVALLGQEHRLIRPLVGWATRHPGFARVLRGARRALPLTSTR